MNSTATRVETSTATRGRILAIEPDATRAAILCCSLDERIDIEIADAVESAIRALERKVPDLLLTPTFLAPADEALLLEHLKKSPAAAHVQVIAAPYFLDADQAPPRPRSSGRVLTFRRDHSSLRPRCDDRTLREQIEDYLSYAEQRRAEREGREPLSECHAGASRSVVGSYAEPALPSSVGSHSGAPLSQAFPGLPPDRRRARRHSPVEIPWLSTIRLPGGNAGKIVDISTGGALLETSVRLSDASTVELQLLAGDTSFSVLARTVRNRVESVDGLGVRYRVAVAFARNLDLTGPESRRDARLRPGVLGDVLARVLGEAHRKPAPELRAQFEQELRRILPVRDIQLRDEPLPTDPETESIYFTVPIASDRRPILQAIFDTGYEPTAVEFKLLRTAASLAAAVLEFAPEGHSGTSNPQRSNSQTSA